MTSKKVILGLGLVLSLSSCAMHEDKYSDQQIFYGETLIDAQRNIERKEANTSFIYDPEKNDCYDGDIEEEY